MEDVGNSAISLTIAAMWDPEASVYVATSEDVPGLVAEDATLDGLKVKVHALIQELLPLNGSPRIAEAMAGTGHDDLEIPVRMIDSSRVTVHA